MQECNSEVSQELETKIEMALLCQKQDSDGCMLASKDAHEELAGVTQTLVLKTDPVQEACAQGGI